MAKNVHLPQELLMEILLRLPVKAILRCRCVCKSWFSLISHPDFATSHFQLASSPATHRLVCLNTYYETLSIDFDASLNDDSSYASLSLHFLCRRHGLKIGGSCRGFLFLYSHMDFYIWNPSTGVHKKIPVSPKTTTYKGHLFPFLYGFAYDYSNDDYLIVLGSFDYNASSSNRVTSSIDLEIFSLRANKWKQIEHGWHLPCMVTATNGVGPRAGLLLNESIHWLVFSSDTLKSDILAFDLKEMTLSEIALPDDYFRATYGHRVYDLVVLGGLIGAWMLDMDTVKIWVMKKYAVHSTWTKTLEFSIVPCLKCSLSIVCFTSGCDIIGTDRDGGLVKLNDKGELLEHYSNSKIFFNSINMIEYTESLLSLPDGPDQS